MATTRGDNISYEQVAEICAVMVKAGEKPSVRSIRAKIGGSPKTVLNYLSQWRDQEALANTSIGEISDVFKNALFAEFGRATATVKTQLESQLDDRKRDLEEAQDAIAEYLNNIDLLKEEFAAFKNSAEQKHLSLEKQIAALEARAQDYVSREVNYQKQIDTLREEKHQAELKTARAETELKELQKHMASEKSKK